jgi:hypothetical protein
LAGTIFCGYFMALKGGLGIAVEILAGCGAP